MLPRRRDGYPKFHKLRKPRKSPMSLADILKSTGGTVTTGRRTGRDTVVSEKWKVHTRMHFWDTLDLEQYNRRGNNMDPRLQAGLELQLEKQAQQEYDSSLSGVLGQYFKQAAETLSEENVNRLANNVTSDTM